MLSHELGMAALNDGNVSDALKYFDLAGSRASESMLLLTTLSLRLDSSADTVKVLQTISGGEYGFSKGSESKDTYGFASSISALSLGLMHKKEISQQWTAQLAPSIQRGRTMARERNRLIGHHAIAFAAKEEDETDFPNHPWKHPLDDSKHIWYVREANSPKFNTSNLCSVPSS